MRWGRTAVLVMCFIVISVTSLIGGHAINQPDSTISAPGGILGIFTWLFSAIAFWFGLLTFSIDAPILVSVVWWAINLAGLVSGLTLFFPGGGGD